MGKIKINVKNCYLFMLGLSLSISILCTTNTAGYAEKSTKNVKVVKSITVKRESNKIDNISKTTNEVKENNAKEKLNKKVPNKEELNKNKLINEVDSYIKTIAPKSKLSGRAIVNACFEYDVDIAFVLAQGQYESHFGTMGRAAKTNSVFNVGGCDGWSTEKSIKYGYGYSHPDKSIRPYLKLLTEKYLGGHKTVRDLMNNYVSLNGQRYASNKEYESGMKRLYSSIKQNTKIFEMYIDCKRARI